MRQLVKLDYPGTIQSTYGIGDSVVSSGGHVVEAQVGLCHKLVNKDHIKEERQVHEGRLGRRRTRPTHCSGSPPHTDVETPIARRYRSLYLFIACTLRTARLHGQ